MIIVLGMHRSGTSALTGALTKCGFYPGRHLIGPTKENPQGHFEPSEIVAFNDALLKESGGAWDKPPKTILWDDVDVKTCRTIIQEVYFGYPRELWVLKDPRLMLLMDFYTRVVPGALVVFINRHIKEIAASLVARDGGGIEDKISLIKEYRKAAAGAIELAYRVEYNALLEHPEAVVGKILSLHASLEGTGPRDPSPEISQFINKEHRHHVATSFI